MSLPAVSTPNDLPLINNTNNDTRMVLSNGTYYKWNTLLNEWFKTNYAFKEFMSLILLHPMMTSAIASNLASNTFNAVSDPSLRQFANLGNYTQVRMQGRIGNSLVAATSILIQYHLSDDINVATNDAGWQTLITSSGGHTLNQMFYSDRILLPEELKVDNVIIRAGMYSGNGAADPRITCCILNFYG